MSKRTWRWVTRDDDNYNVKVWMRVNIPRMRVSNACPMQCKWTQSGGENTRVALCFRQFKMCTGITVPSSHPIKVDFGGVKVVE